jgi:phosphotriesterase-related protein
MVSITTVSGAIEASELGITLFHEHLLNDATKAWHPPDPEDSRASEIANGPVRMEYLGTLRNDPYLSRDNTLLDRLDVAIEEAGFFAAAGGRTVIDQTVEGMGRDPEKMKVIAEATGLQIVMGCGFYLERTHPPRIASMSADDVADSVERDLVEGWDGIRPGLIGEIGIGPSFTSAEEKVLRGAAKAQRRTGVPLSVHLPGWQRHGHRVLDVVEEEGGNLAATVLSHMNPSHNDPGYQRSLADRGAWIEYDMIGMELNYPGEGQSPSDEQNARAVAELVRDGYADRLLLSHDIFIKTLLRRWGGFGYDHVLTSFVPRLEDHGVSRETALGLLTTNPRRVFETAAEGARR